MGWGRKKRGKEGGKNKKESPEQSVLKNSNFQSHYLLFIYLFTYYDQARKAIYHNPPNEGHKVHGMHTK